MSKKKSTAVAVKRKRNNAPRISIQKVVHAIEEEMDSLDQRRMELEFELNAMLERWFALVILRDKISPYDNKKPASSVKPKE